MQNNTQHNLINTVIAGGYCIGCGACASVEKTPFRMGLDSDSQYKSMVISDLVGDNIISESLMNICPFSDNAVDEDCIAESLYGANQKHNEVIGFYRSIYAGYVATDSFRSRGSSGGFGSWILSYLLEHKLVDGIIHVKENTEGSSLFSYQISRSVTEVLSGAKSKYYPIELSDVIKKVKAERGTYAFVGVPCFVKAMRLMMRQDPILESSIKFCIGLVCGHLKSSSFAEMFAWQCGVHPSNLSTIDFRVKLDGYEASRYSIAVVDRNSPDNRIISPPISELYGSDWGHGFFKINACDYCDDVLAETADLTIGDAWLPRYVKDAEGTNIIIIRNKELESIVEKARKEKAIVLDDISEKDILRSQRAGIAHRREGLSYRLYLKDKNNVWRPRKRVNADITISRKRQEVLDLRIELATQSHISFRKALENNNFQLFKNDMDVILVRYNRLYRKPLYRRILSKCINLFFSK